MKTIALYPGTFDPFTNGHGDLVLRAAQMFEKIFVAVADNADKNPLFSLAERIRLAKVALGDLPKVQVIGFDNLLIDCAREYQAGVILRGLRAVSDFEYEFQLASMNRRLQPELETVFLAPAEQYTFVSASLIKEIARYGGDVSAFVHNDILRALQNKFS